MTGTDIMNKRYDLSLRKESVISNFEECGISQQDRNFYFERPDVWDWNSNYSSQLNDGVKAVLSAYSPPIWIESNQQKTMFRKLKSKYKALERAEKAAEKFGKDVDKACDNNDLLFIMFFLQADEAAGKVTSCLRQAYDDLEKVCWENKFNKEFNEYITDNLMSYINYQTTLMFQDVDDKFQDLKKQINIRRILEQSTFESWQKMGLEEDD